MIPNLEDEKSIAVAELRFARVDTHRANRLRHYLTAICSRLKVQWLAGYRARCSQHGWFSIVTLLDARSVGASPNSLKLHRPERRSENASMRFPCNLGPVWTESAVKSLR